VAFLFAICGLAGALFGALPHFLVGFLYAKKILMEYNFCGIALKWPILKDFS